MSDRQEDDEEEQRTTAIGLFNYAETYWQAAKALREIKLRTTHPDAPVEYLYYHAIELYLKSFLRMHGHTARELRSGKFGHRTDRLSERAAELGLFLMDEDKEVFSMMGSTDIVIRSRYLRTGYFTIPTPDALDRTCVSLRESIGEELRKRGETVRLERFRVS